MIQSYKRYWKNYFRFNKTATRGEVWWPILINMVITVVYGVIIGMVNSHPTTAGRNFVCIFLYAAFLLVTSLGTVFATVRRLKTVGESWAKVFLLLIPVIGFILVAVAVSQKDEDVCKSKGHLFKAVPDTCTEKCERCGQTREMHDWDGCKCKACGTVRDMNHAFTKFDKEKCKETCEKCGKTRARHSWDGCKCTVCGKQRNEGHKFEAQQNSCWETCAICGTVREGKHSYDASGTCTVCGKKKPVVFTLATLSNAEFESVKFALGIIAKTPGIDSALTSGCQKLNFNLVQTSNLNAEDLKTAFTASFLVSTAIATDKKAMNGNDINSMISRMHLLNLINAKNKLQKLLDEVQDTAPATPAQPANTAAPQKGFQKKPLAEFPPYDESYNGYVKGGVCDVCNASLEGKKAYAVDNQTFYDSPDYYAHAAKVQKDMSGLEMTRADYERRRAMDHSPGSAVCENCMHMFAVMPDEAGAEPSEKKYYEADNVGSRHDTMSRAAAYWMAERPGKAVKPPFTMYSMPSYESGEAALLTLPFIHKAADSGKLISERLMTFGVYETTENGKPTGTYEALICGTDLTKEEFEQAEAAFEANGGKRKNNLAPEGSPAPAIAANGSARNVSYKEMLKNENGTYMVHTAPTKSDALAFLKTQTVNRPSLFVVVDTPEGSIGKDINGIYEE